MSKRGKRSAKFTRARVRHMLLTTGPNRLSRGWLVRRHHHDPVELREQDIVLPSWPAPLTRTPLTAMPHETQPSDPCATSEKTVVPCSSSHGLPPCAACTSWKNSRVQAAPQPVHKSGSPPRPPPHQPSVARPCAGPEFFLVDRGTLVRRQFLMQITMESMIIQILM